LNPKFGIDIGIGIVQGGLLSMVRQPMIGVATQGKAIQRLNLDYGLTAKITNQKANPCKYIAFYS
jgi:hypothetical protein